MSQTISGYHNTPITLASGGAYTQPTTITGTLQAFGGTALQITNPWNLTLTGDILGPTHYGTLIEAQGYLSFTNTGTLAGGAAGLGLYIGGNITNTATATIGGYEYGINAYAAGDAPGIDHGFFTIQNAGTIYATSGTGIFGGPGLISNTGDILGPSFGILDATTVQNAGFIRGREIIGVGLNIGGTLTNSAQGTIIGGLFGVYASTDTFSTVINSGTILGGQNVAVHMGLGALTNTSTGTLVGGNGAVYLAHPASLTNAGLILGEDDGSTGISLSQGGIITNTGTIIAYTAILINSGSITNSGLIQGEIHSNDTGLIAPDAAAIAVDFTAPGNFTENGGTVLGTLIGDGGTLTLHDATLSEVTGFTSDRFTGNSTLTTTLAGLGTISGFSAGDQLHLTDQTATSGIFLGADLTLSNNATIAFAGTYATHAFTITADPDGGTDIEIPCFRAGTRIATPTGQLPVESLAIGDLVLTLHAGPQPIRWIGTRTYPAPFANHDNIRPIRLAAGALAPGIPSRDLYVSPGHAIFCGGRLIHADRLVNGTTITQVPAVDAVTYFHLELPAHDILLAESCPAESLLGAGFRHLFQNPAPDFPDLPGLPLCNQGFPLHPGPPAAIPGPIRAHLDSTGATTIAGWAQHIFAPESPVILDIICRGRRLARVLANHYRADLRQAGLGSGRHGFSIPRPAWAAGEITLKKAALFEKSAQKLLQL